jgi:phage anti-repressor protein
MTKDEPTKEATLKHMREAFDEMLTEVEKPDVEVLAHTIMINIGAGTRISGKGKSGDLVRSYLVGIEEVLDSPVEYDMMIQMLKQAKDDRFPKSQTPDYDYSNLPVAYARLRSPSEILQDVIRFTSAKNPSEEDDEDADGSAIGVNIHEVFERIRAIAEKDEKHAENERKRIRAEEMLKEFEQ